MVSMGNSQQAGGAKKTLTYAVGGLIIVLMSAVIVKLVLVFFSGGVTPPKATTTTTTTTVSYPQFVNNAKSTPGIRAGETIKKCTYNGEVVYLFPTGSYYPDAYTTALFYNNQTLICYPDGGISGHGDGKCPGFTTSTCKAIHTY